jgi:beta-lactamase superfamily II metal-dependent hydrolase
MSTGNGFEIDFLPVGNGKRSGDAIAIRYGTEGNYKVLVYDGGTKDSGELLVDHIKKYYNTTFVDYVINSHPDSDHASGLSIVLEKLQVGQLWMHRPWAHSSIILDYFKDGRITDSSLAERLKDSMSSAYKLEELAQQKKINIYEPFRGSQIGLFTVLSPEKDWYVHDLIAEFTKSPEQITETSVWGTVTKSFTDTVIKTASWIMERWDIETLHEDVSTTAENESSVILYGNIENKGILLTGDAGVRALCAAAYYVESNGNSLNKLINFIQVPHHGSRNNISSSVLDKIIGPRKSSDDGITKKTAFVSVSEKSDTHPRRAVVNAFIRRDTTVIPTKGSTSHYFHNMPPRPGWFPATPLTFSNQVESWD